MSFVGYAFRPTEQELVDYYLKYKLLADDLRAQVIPVIDLCDVEPWDVPVILAKSAIRFGDPDWFFFSPVGFKYSKSKRFNRTTKCGFWKATGLDREVRSCETNALIGTKKTLVFYEGRVSVGAKSIWVIHEYHAATFPESQRTFVLCRLMKKPEKTTKGGTDTLICDEREPSRSMENQATAEGIPSAGIFTGMETIFQATSQAEKYFPPTHQCPIRIEQEEASFPNPSNNAYFKNENSIMQTSFEIIKEDEFLKSILADEHFVIDEESMHASFNSSTQSESLKRVYYKSNDIDAEVVSKLDGNTVDNSTVRSEYPNAEEYHSSKRFKSSYNDVPGDTCFPSSNPEADQETKESVFRDDLWGWETSSCDSTIDKPLEINCMEISSSPTNPWSWEN